MSTTVDNRIVEMQFNNRDFEKKISTTITSLDKLNSTLKMEGATKGFENLQKAFGRMDLSPVISAAETVNQRFSAMGIMGMEVLERLANKAMDVGNRIADALFVQPPKEGFGEYELEIGSVQTIQASTGEDFDKIYEYLAQLNEYADQTIYSFSDMTSNIGKFTNAGVKLEDAVAAIKGISNEAALSGANANEASRAMYNFAQALSSGAVRLIDWHSIETANMATAEFRQQLIDTAVELGVLTKNGDMFVSTTTDMNGKVSNAFNATTGFNESLSHMWMTTEVLTETLKKYADETTNVGKRAYHAAKDVKSFSQLMDTTKEVLGTGWADSFRLVIGQFEDAKELWTNVANVIGELIFKMDEFRNHALRFWAANEGRDKMIKALSNVYQGLAKRIEPIQKALYTVFPQLNRTGHILLDFTDRVLQASVAFRDFGGKELTGKAKIFERASIVFETLKNVVSSAMLVFRKGSKVIKIFGQSFSDAFDGTSILEVIKSISEGILTFIKNFKIAGERADLLKRTFDGLFAAVDILLIPIKAVVKAIKPMFSSFSGGEPRILRITAAIGDFIVSLRDAIKEGKGFGEAFGNISKVGKTIKNAFTGVTKVFSNLSGLDISKITEKIKSLFSSVGKGDYSAIFTSIGNGFKKFATAIKDFISGVDITDVTTILPDGAFGKNMLKPLNKAKDTVVKVITTIKNVFSSLFDFLKQIFGGIGDVFESFWNTLSKLLSGIGDVGSAVLGFFTTVIPKIGDFIGEFFGMFTSVETGFGKIFTSFSDMFSKILDTIGQHPAGAAAAGGGFYLLDIIDNLIKFLLTLAKDPVKALSDVGEQLALFIKNLKKGSEEINNILGSIREAVDAWKKDKTADMMLKIAIGVGILAAAVAVLALLDPFKVGIAVGAITALFIELMIGLSKLQKNFGEVDLKFGAISTVMLKMAAAMFIIGAAVAKIAKVGDIGSIVAATIAIAGILDEMMNGIIKMNNEIEDPKKLNKLIGFLVVFTLCIDKLSFTMAILGFLPVANIVTGLVAVTVLIAAIGGFVTWMAKVKPDPEMLKGLALALLTFGRAVRKIGKVVTELSVLSVEELVKGLIGVAVIFAGIIGVVTALGKALGGSAGSDMGKNMLLASVGIVLIAHAIDALVPSVLLIANMGWESLGKGLLGVIAMLAMMVAALSVLGKMSKGGGGDLVLAGVAILIVAKAMTILIEVFERMSKISWKSIAKGLVAIGGALAIFVIAGAFAPYLMSFGAALILIGLGATLVSTGVWLIADAFSAFGDTLIKLSVMWPTISTMFDDLVDHIGKAMPTLASAFVDGLKTLAVKIIGAAPIIGKAVVTIIMSIFTALTGAVPLMAEQTINNLVTILTLIRDNGEVLITGLLDIVFMLLQGLADRAEALGGIVADFLVLFLVGVVNSVAANVSPIVESIFNLIISIIDAIAKLFDEEHVETFEKSAGTLIKNFLKATLKVIVDLATKFNEIGSKIMTYILNAIKAKFQEFKKWVTAIPKKIKAWFKEKISDIQDIGKQLVNGIRDGIEAKIESLKKKASNVAQTVLDTICDALGIASPSKEGVDIGKFFDMGIADGLDKFSSKVGDSAGGVGDDILGSFKDAFSDSSDLASGFSFEPSVNPVMDTDDLASGMGDMDNMFSKYQGTAFGGGSIDVAQSASSTITAEISDEQRQMYNKLTEMIAQLQDQLNNVIIVPQDTDINITENIDGRTLAEMQAPFLDVVMSERYDDASAGRTQSDQYTGANTYRMLRQPANINPYKK